MTEEWLPVGTSPLLVDKDSNPEIFPFANEYVEPVSIVEEKGGCLYDFGKQIFAELHISNIEGDKPIHFFYGESEAEALDTDFSYIRDIVPLGTHKHIFPPRAFRYVFVCSEDNRYNLQANSQYLPLNQRGSFSCSDPLINRIWEVAEYTLRLNSREFSLDGIKRDRWVWSGDAYQSYLVNYYLYFDQDICRRTMFALRGKDPVEQHINTIVDYSFFWFVGFGTTIYSPAIRAL